MNHLLLVSRWLETVAVRLQQASGQGSEACVGATKELLSGLAHQLQQYSELWHGLRAFQFSKSLADAEVLRQRVFRLWGRVRDMRAEWVRIHGLGCDVADMVFSDTEDLALLAAELGQDLRGHAALGCGPGSAASRVVPADPVRAHLAPRDVCKQLGIPESRFHAARKRLERWRAEHLSDGGSGWIEVASRSSREPQFLYSPSAVQDLLEDLVEQPR